MAITIDVFFFLWSHSSVSRRSVTSSVHIHWNMGAAFILTCAYSLILDDKLALNIQWSKYMLFFCKVKRQGETVFCPVTELFGRVIKGIIVTVVFCWDVFPNRFLAIISHFLNCRLHSLHCILLYITVKTRRHTHAHTPTHCDVCTCVFSPVMNLG